MVSEADLILRVQSGDAAAAWDLLEPYQQPLFRYLQRLLSNQDDAADALQDTFLRALRGLSDLNDPARFRAWIFRIAHNQAVSQGRQTSRMNLVTLQPDALADASQPPSGRILQQEQRRRLTEAIDALPGAEREVVWLRLAEELTFREIAEITDSPLGTVLSRMHQAKMRLRDLLT